MGENLYTCVSDDYKVGDNRFTGKIHKVTVQVGKSDLNEEAQRAIAEMRVKEQWPANHRALHLFKRGPVGLPMPVSMEFACACCGLGKGARRPFNGTIERVHSKVRGRVLVSSG